jgi:protein-L-isoaspartate(D-aspartate) O-methyltransferase
MHDDAAGLQAALIEKLKRDGSIRTPRVEAAFRAVPRHLFLPGVPWEQVYSDEAIATKHQDGLAISSSSQPAIMAIMLEQLELEPGHRVLEIGAGTGYNAALMAQIVGETGRVITIDIDEDLAAGARERLATAGFGQVQVICGDGAYGYEIGAPYDRIILTVAAGDITPAWREQLKPRGRFLLPLSIRVVQESVAFQPANRYLESVSVRDCGFMMLRGAFAEATTVLALGSEPGLHLCTQSSDPVDADTIYQWLTGPSRDWTTSVRAMPRELFGDLRLWLALREPRFCDVNAWGEGATRSFVPSMFATQPEQRWRFTSGLLDEGGLAVFTHSSAATPSSDDGAAHPRAGARSAGPGPGPEGRADRSAPCPRPLVIRSFGPDETLAHRLMEQVTAWDEAGRPSTERLRIRAYPLASPHRPSADEIVIEKRSTWLVLDWQ